LAEALSYHLVVLDALLMAHHRAVERTLRSRTWRSRTSRVGAQEEVSEERVGTQEEVSEERVDARL
jgi:hypothetical protein